MKTLLLICFSQILFSQNVRFATYNIGFMDDSISVERAKHLQSVLKNLNADIIAFQEIENPDALKRIVSNDYNIYMIDDPKEVQELAFLVRTGIKVDSLKYIFPQDSLDDAFPRSRNLLHIQVTINNQFVHVYSHHAKSRAGKGRLKTDIQRIRAAKLMANYFRSNMQGKLCVLMGDFNDTPDDLSLSIIESGNINAGAESSDFSLFTNLTEKLYQNDRVSIGLNDLYSKSDDSGSEELSTIVLGSRAENNKFRNLEYNFYKDTKIKQVLFDNILISSSTIYIDKVDIYNKSDALFGKDSKQKFEKSGIVYEFRGDLASDHLPVYADILFTAEKERKR